MILSREDAARVLRAVETLPAALQRDAGVRRLSDAARWLLGKRAILPSVSLASRPDAIAVVAGLDRVDPALADVARRAQNHLAGRDTCTHPTTRNLYDQRPPSEGRLLAPRARVCETCGALIQLYDHERGSVTPP